MCSSVNHLSGFGHSRKTKRAGGGTWRFPERKDCEIIGVFRPLSPAQLGTVRVGLVFTVASSFMSACNTRTKAAVVELLRDQITVISVSQTWEINSEVRLTGVSPL